MERLKAVNCENREFYAGEVSGFEAAKRIDEKYYYNV
jgi:hypothetical protein